ncbi:uncharacterized protein TNCV_4398361 [Trichonephila clavipes]|nr:uncharacterized protein TNCV_4398361 [Trichonephila clavipes]
MVPQINTRGVTMYCRQCHLIPAVEAVCSYKAKVGLRRSPQGLHTRTRLSSLLRLNLDSRASLKTTWFHFSAVQFPPVRHHFKRSRLWGSVKGSTRKRRSYMH